MELDGKFHIPTTRERVWQALNDPDILRRAVPGCEALEKTSDNEFTAKVTLKIGPVKASFKGRVTLSDLDPPNSYSITGEGQGGVAGFARGSAKVTLSEDGEGTCLRYTATATVGGKLGQIGQRLIDATAKKMARQFFESFAAYLEAKGAPEGEAGEAAPPAAAQAKVADGQGLFWGMIGVALVILWIIN